MQTTNRNVLIAVGVAVVAIILIVLFLLLRGGGSSTGGLTGTLWQLSSIRQTTPAFQGVVPVEDQPRYAITFNTNGTFSAKADCNTLQGGYVAGTDGKLTLTPGPSTIVQCPEGSLSDLYIIGLDKVASYAIAGSQLTIKLDDQGTLVYKSATPLP